MDKNTFRDHYNAVHVAHFRAAMTRLRYKVRLEPNNHLWVITETVIPIDPPKE